MSLEQLIKQTNAYKIIRSEKRFGALSHAYLVIVDDGEYLRRYLNVFARLIMCGEEDFCGVCRACRLIEKEKYADCTFYPAESGSILTADVEDVICQSYIKPLENSTRLFVLCGAENMNAAAQNKILKTLEEPPENVVILMGATSDHQLLPTIKSRVKRLEIPPFGESALTEFLKEKFTDEDKIARAVSLCGGKASAAVRYCENGNGETAYALARSVLDNMKTSRDVLRYASEINKDNISDFINALEQETAKLYRLAIHSGAGEANGFKTGALVGITDMLAEMRRRLNFNANAQMTADGILFGILEEKYKWQKL
ncbi:MAG: hypothetical protein J5903_04295 [Clostridia bacterium]|nr:hypothetical protein [Clostridia bacterium]